MKKIILCLCFLIGSLASSYGQCEAINEAIQPGETLSYELKFNWKFIWINAGWAKMTVNRAKVNGLPCLQTDLESYTNKRIDFFFKMRDTLTCITTENLVPLFFRKGAEEGKHYTVDEISFAYKDGKVFVDQQRITKDKSIRARKDTLSSCVYDMLSIMLQARSFDASSFRPGQKMQFAMATGKRIENQTLIYRRKKNYKAKNGVTYRCLVFSLVEYTKKNKEKEVITFYITDDKNHLPVRLDMFLNFGSAKAFLKEIKGNRHPLTSVVNEEADEVEE